MACWRYLSSSSSKPEWFVSRLSVKYYGLKKVHINTELDYSADLIRILGMTLAVHAQNTSEKERSKYKLDNKE